jgi:hypothetical protein
MKNTKSKHTESPDVPLEYYSKTSCNRDTTNSVDNTHLNKLHELELRRIRTKHKSIIL